MDIEQKESSPQLVNEKRSRTGASRTTRILFIFVIVLILITAVILLVQQVQKSQDPRTNANQNQPEKQSLGNPVKEEISESIVIVSPRDGDVVQNPIKVEAQLSNGTTPQRVEFWMDNEKEPFYIADEGPYSIVVPDLTPGTHSLYVKAYDAEGNGAISKSVQIRIAPDSVPPQGRGEKE